MYKRILVPTDGSPISLAAADGAIRLASACGSEIIAFSVATPEAYSGGAVGGLVSGAGPQVDTLLEQAESLAAGIAERAQAAGVPCTTLTAYSLSPGEAIVDAARDRNCDLIVMGSHGLRGLTRLIVSSVTHHVLAYSEVPVTVFRPARDDGADPTFR